MKSEAINSVIRALKENPQVSAYKLNVSHKESFELFFVKGRLETVRSTETCDRQVTVYVDHDGFRGDAQFFLYPSTTYEDMKEKIAVAVRNAALMKNAPYELPGAEISDSCLDSNLGEKPMPALAEQIAELVFAANTQEGGSLNAVEVFLDRYTDSVANSRGLQKSQKRFNAMVEAIPTFNGSKESVELYEQYNFSALDPDALLAEIGDKMAAVKARYDAVKPDFSMDCKVVLNRQELGELFGTIARDLNYATVYSHGNLFHKGDRLQTAPAGDAFTLTMKGAVPGNIGSSDFDSDGLSLTEITLIRNGAVENYYGSNRFGQYLGEQPTGNLGCLCVEPGTFAEADLHEPYLEVLAMSGLQVDFFNDYIGGEVRLAYYHDGDRMTPVTGISISGSFRDVMNHMGLSGEIAMYDNYIGPAKAILDHMKIF